MDWTTIVVALIGIVGGSGITGLVATVLKRRWDKQDKDADTTKAIKHLEEKVDELVDKVGKVIKAQKVITKERIQYLGRCYIYAGEISIDDKSTLHEMHDVAEDLELNGSLDVVMGEVDSLPLKPPSNGKA